MLSRDASGGKVSPSPSGYVEARLVGGRPSEAGSVYLLYSPESYLRLVPVGHVTDGGRALRYGAFDGAPETLPPGRVMDQFARVLGVEGPLHVYDLAGKPRALP